MPISRYVEQLIAEKEKQGFFAGLADDFLRLRSDSAAWHDYQAELAEWDQVLGDGLGSIDKHPGE